jgi:hypothetical protein
MGHEKTSKLAAGALATAKTDGFKVDAAWQTTARHSLTGNTAEQRTYPSAPSESPSPHKFPGSSYGGGV